MSTIRHWRDMSLSEHISLRDAATTADFRFQSLSIYGTTSAPLYAAVMIKWNPFPAQRDFPLQTRHEMAQTIAAQLADGFTPIVISAVGSATDPRFACVFAQVPGIVSSLDLTNGSASDPKTIQYAMAANKTAGLILRWATMYGNATDPRFAAIWQPQGSDPYMWNADGVVETPAAYEERVTAQKQAWARPYFLTGSADHQLLSAFACNEVGGWEVLHGIDGATLASSYQTYADGKHMIPMCVEGVGADATSARFTAVFATDATPKARTFTATGPVANAAIDTVVRAGMQGSPVRHAALAIVHGKRLVYARGYTLAEPDWPIVQPTTCFRLASNSKTVTALAAYQLYEADHTFLDRSVQDILHLRTPSGGTPTDPRFAQITVRHLLEHRSGVFNDANWDSIAIQSAFAAAGHPIDLPVSRAQTDAYMASQMLVTAPGAAYAYNNAGYYLLGRVVTKLRGASDLIDACAPLFGPLGITRIRNAKTLAADQPADEARYQSSQLTVGPSVMSNAQPLVADTMGTVGLATLEGGGGLSGAATDLACLLAIVMSGADSPALKYATISTLMKAGIAALTLPGQARAGYGWDGIAQTNATQFYAEKGGSLDTDHSGLEVNGDWGFAMLWSGDPSAATGWYPDYPSVMNLARMTPWGTDLFPHFGMPALP